MPHRVYLVRHGEQQDAEHGVEDGPLSPRGVRQAEAIAARLSGVDFTAAYHSPLERAAETARIMQRRLPAVDLQPSSLLMDCIPTGLESEPPASYRAFFTGVTPAQVEAGRAQMADALDRWLTPIAERTDVLLVTHNFVIGWFVRHVLDAPDWRWMSINQANCGLTVLHLKPGRPAQLVTHNDLGHLPMELRTGLPVSHHV